ncbi:MAG: tyrosine-type recombinase/integrase, partial [Aestuariibacter sp.]|nr:tyrosine-type recombinase/integrase [Aestuariibacter sp.]
MNTSAPWKALLKETVMQMTNVIINFRRHLKRRNYSPHTVKYYLNILKQFVLWLDVAIEQVTDKKIDAYIDYLHDKRMQPASINCYLAIIRVFYSYLKYEEQVKLTNPVKSGRRLRVPKPLPRPLREDQIDQFFDVIKSKRDWAMFRLMLRCGLRVEEVSDLTLGAIDLKQCKIMVLNGKGSKDRVVYMSDDAADALDAYLKLRRHYRVKKVFLVEKGDYKGKPISVRGIQKRIEYYAKKSGVPACCHRLRHTMATQLLNAEAEVETIQDLLGHNWITTTQRYCKVSNVKVKRDYFKAMQVILSQS